MRDGRSCRPVQRADAVRGGLTDPGAKPNEPERGAGFDASSRLRRVVAASIGVLWLGSSAAHGEIGVDITYLTQAERVLPPLSLAEPVLEDEGLAGARQALSENQTTGSFLGHTYRLIERIVPEDGGLASEFEAALREGERLFVADLRADDLQTLAPLADERGALLFNSRAPDDSLRRDQCWWSLFHTAPSHAMQADALIQYLAWKRWTRLLLILGARPEDQLYAEAFRRAAKRFGLEIVEERVYEGERGARRTDTGHIQVQSQMPVFTQGAAEHDVVLAADEADVFAEYLPYRTWEPRPVTGSAGLTPTAWSRVHEQWGGTQLQRRFAAGAGRWMTSRDFNAWLAVRVIGEAVTRTASAEPGALHDYLVSDVFEIAAFKGEPLTFRPWNQQLRQPILITSPRMLVSVSPQNQFLHQRTPLDTLGYDRPESMCDLN